MPSYPHRQLVRHPELVEGRPAFSSFAVLLGTGVGDSELRDCFLPLFWKLALPHRGRGGGGGVAFLLASGGGASCAVFAVRSSLWVQQP
jgi:hypothetical protein